ncbi:Hypothetical predicted protein [Podarcis lilfordi]|uniref:Uncharacterized protein n=1 Tax=Podarcis lilfordi TaxID=74358 RepID=A0AA35KYL7_9SAUR|nr:Hypothetical predicted protein [Podarcis lilfordi]
MEVYLDCWGSVRAGRYIVPNWFLDHIVITFQKQLIWQDFTDYSVCFWNADLSRSSQQKAFLHEVPADAEFLTSLPDDRKRKTHIHCPVSFQPLSSLAPFCRCVCLM